MTKRLSLQSFVESVEESEIRGMAIASIVLPDSQPRRYFPPDKQAELEQSIKEHGILQPLLVRPIGGGKYELVAGERRLRAAKAVDLNSVPVVIREFTTEQAQTIALVENLQREDLNPVEETEAILGLLTLQLGVDTEIVVSLLQQMRYAVQNNSLNNVIQKEETLLIQVFEKLGMGWESFTVNRLPLLNLPQDVLEVLRQGKLEYTKARAIARVKDESARAQLLQTAITNNLSLKDIKEKITTLTEKPQPTAQKKRIQSMSQKLTKSKLWETDPKTWSKIEKHIDQIERLLE